MDLLHTAKHTFKNPAEGTDFEIRQAGPSEPLTATAARSPAPKTTRPSPTNTAAAAQIIGSVLI